MTKTTDNKWKLWNEKNNYDIKQLWDKISSLLQKMSILILCFNFSHNHDLVSHNCDFLSNIFCWSMFICEEIPT